jgi:glycosyltransferase involved in cell wall biosynthesis
MSAPLISVVIPAYNSAAFLAETLASVFAQDHRPLEVILVDDGSTDETLAIAQAWMPEVRTMRQENAGPGAARNRGIEMARGEFIAFIDADDLWPAGKLARQLRLLQSRPDLDLVLGLVQLDYQGSAKTGTLRFRDARQTVAFFSFGAALFRRECFERAGLLSVDLNDTEDADWFLRARDAGLAWLVLDEVALIYRRHGTNMTEHRPLPKSDIFRVLARAANRRRSRWGEHLPTLDRLTDRMSSADPSPQGEDDRDA